MPGGAGSGATKPPERPQEAPSDLYAMFYGFSGGRFWGHDKVINALIGIGVETPAEVATLTVAGLKLSSGFGGKESRIPDKIAEFLAERWGIVLAAVAPRPAAAGRMGPPGIWDPPKPSRVVIDVSPSGVMLPVPQQPRRYEL